MPDVRRSSNHEKLLDDTSHIRLSRIPKVLQRFKFLTCEKAAAPVMKARERAIFMVAFFLLLFMQVSERKIETARAIYFDKGSFSTYQARDP